MFVFLIILQFFKFLLIMFFISISLMSTEATGKLHSLEEIEAKLRGIEANKQNALNVTTSASDRKKKEEEAEAFKKLVRFR